MKCAYTLRSRFRKSPRLRVRQQGGLARHLAAQIFVFSVMASKEAIHDKHRHVRCCRWSAARPAYFLPILSAGTVVVDGRLHGHDGIMSVCAPKGRANTPGSRTHTRCCPVTRTPRTHFTTLILAPMGREPPVNAQVKGARLRTLNGTPKRTKSPELSLRGPRGIQQSCAAEASLRAWHV